MVSLRRKEQVRDEGKVKGALLMGSVYAKRCTNDDERHP